MAGSHRSRSTLTAIAGAAAVVAIVLAGAILWRSWVAAGDIVHPKAVLGEERPSDFGHTYEDVALETDDGLTLRGWFLPPRQRPGPVVIVQAGHDSTRTSVITHTAMLADHGYGVLAFDWRATGESDGDTYTLGFHERRDVFAASDWLQHRSEVDGGRVGALGQSAGAAAIIRAAADDPRIAAVVAETTYASLRDIMESGIEARTGLPAFPFAEIIVRMGEARAGVDIDDVRPVDDIGRISPRPILLIRAGGDTWVDASNADMLMSAAGEPKELWDAPDAEHSDVLEMMPNEYERRVVAFFNRYLGSGND